MLTLSGQHPLVIINSSFEYLCLSSDLHNCVFCCKIVLSFSYWTFNFISSSFISFCVSTCIFMIWNRRINYRRTNGEGEGLWDEVWWDLSRCWTGAPLPSPLSTWEKAHLSLPQLIMKLTAKNTKFADFWKYAADSVRLTPGGCFFRTSRSTEIC